MRVIYKNKYKAVRNLWKRVDLYLNISRFIAGLTILLTLLLWQEDWVKGVMVFVSGISTWAVYAMLTDNKVRYLREEIEDLQSRWDDSVLPVSMALVKINEPDKYALGLDINGRVHKIVSGNEDAPVIVDCLTNEVIVSAELEDVINSGRIK